MDHFLKKNRNAKSVIMKREEIYKAIDSEKAYQDALWNPETTETEGKHSLQEWFTYMDDYVREALHKGSRLPDPEASNIQREILRKVLTIGIAAAEEHGMPLREMPSPEEIQKGSGERTNPREMKETNTPPPGIFIEQDQHDWKEIKNESYREYSTEKGPWLSVLNVQWLAVSKSGGHRLITYNNGVYQGVYVQPREGWSISWYLKPEE